MKIRQLCVFAAALLMSSAAYGQMKVMGSLRCDKPDPSYSVTPSDKAGHTLSLIQGNCRWTKIDVMAGVTQTTNTSWETVDTHGNSAHVNGYAVSSDGSGNDAYVKFSAAQSLKAGGMMRESGRWSYTGGAGKFNGLKGTGTFTCMGAADGSADCKVMGTYSIGTAMTK
jgi:hypothetical protein